MKKLLIITIFIAAGILLCGVFFIVKAENCIECAGGSLNKGTSLKINDPNSSSLYQRFVFTLPGGYAAAGVGMRNRGYGDIAINDIPSGSTIEAAYLYWDILDNSEYPEFKNGKFNGTSINGAKIGEGPDPCWLPTVNFAYRAEVTNLVSGNGTYSLTDFASGRRDGCDSWVCISDFPLMEGASLVIIYRNSNSPLQTIVIYDGAATLENNEYSHTITGFTASSPVANASITYLGADGQNGVGGLDFAEDTYFNETKIADRDWEGSDPQAGPSYQSGNLWDTNTYDVTSLINSGDTSATAKVRSYPGKDGYSDCLVWVATVFSVSTTRIFPDKAVGLAKEVFGAPYLGDGMTWGGKGYDYKEMKFATSSKIKEGGYWYWNNKLATTTIGVGIDCSGLTLWSYNRAYFGDKKVNFGGKCLTEKECPISYEKAYQQHGSNTTPISKENLQPGDLLFFDAYLNDGIIDHVAMYIGGDINNIIHPNLFTGTTTYATYNFNTEEVTTVKPGVSPKILKVKAYGRVIDPKIALKTTATSKVDLIITDPDGLITTKENPWGYPMEYQVYDINEDGELDDIVISGERKIGDYLIQVVPESDALPNDTFTLTIEALVNGATVTKVLAENVPISDIPGTPYAIRATETEIIPIIPMKSFLTKKMLIFWGIDCPEVFEKLGDIDDFSKFQKEYQITDKKLPKKCFKKENAFIISGTLELPENYQRENLDKSVFLNIQIADKIGKDKAVLKELKNLWLYQEPQKDKDDSLKQGIDIKTMAIHWLPEKECKFFKWRCKEKLAKNWFYIRGELSLEGIDVNTLPRKAAITLEIPIAAYEKAGGLSGKETIEFKKLRQVWFYHSPDKWKDWQDGWWKKWDNFQDQGGFTSSYLLQGLKETAAALGLYFF